MAASPSAFEHGQPISNNAIRGLPNQVTRHVNSMPNLQIRKEEKYHHNLVSNKKTKKKTMTMTVMILMQGKNKIEKENHVWQQCSSQSLSRPSKNVFTTHDDFEAILLWRQQIFFQGDKQEFLVSFSICLLTICAKEFQKHVVSAVQKLIRNY